MVVRQGSVRRRQADARNWLACALILTLAACGSSGSERPRAAGPGPHFKIGQPYQINGRWYYPEFVTEYEATGVASWYGHSYHGRLTANGEVYDMYALTAAHRSLPLGTRVRVTNLKNGRSVVVRINDRGPYKRGVIIDLSRRAASQLGMIQDGRVRVEVAAIRS